MITSDDLGIATDYGLLDNQVRIVTQTMSKICPEKRLSLLGRIPLVSSDRTPLIDFVLARLSSGHRSGAIWAESVSPESILTATWSAYFLFPES